MKYLTKVEIITDAVEVGNISKLLDEIGVSGYSIIKNVAGKGRGGLRLDSDLTGLFENSYIMVVCNEIEMCKIVEAVRPIIKKFGGIFIVSDVTLRIQKDK